MDYVEVNNEKYYVKDFRLDLVNLGIKDITEIKGLENLHNLRFLFLTSNKITRIQGLENLLNLEEISLDNNKIEIIEGLENLRKLRSLDLRENNIHKIENLKNLHNVEILDLSLNSLSEISGLQNLKILRILNLSNNKIIEIKGLEDLDKLEELIIENNFIIEIKGLENLFNLEKLSLGGNSIKEIKGLEKLINLTRLELDNNEIKEIKELNNLKNLRDLELSDNKIHEIENLDNNSKLKFLGLNGNRIEMIKGIGNLVNLEELFLDENQIQNISNLGGLTYLRSLLLRGNMISKIEGLESLVNLEFLLLDYNQISEINGLDKNLNLIELTMEKNMIHEIRNLDHLKKLTYLDLSNNKITELENLENLKSLEEIELENNNFKGYDEYIVKSGASADEIKKYCRQKKEKELPKYDFYNKDLSFDQNILEIKNKLNNIDDSEFIQIGTFEEDENIKEMQNFYFLNLNPEIIFLSDNQLNTEKVKINLMQLHSLKGIIYPREDKIKFFLNFLNHFWNQEEINSNNVLIYKELENRVIEKIKELFDLSVNNSSAIPNIVVFPECSLPYKIIPFLIEFSEKYKLIIIGGLEHRKLDDSENYINQVIIIDSGNSSYQIKQTPVQIKSGNVDSTLREKIECTKIPRIRIFATSLGKIALFICRDFLRLHDKISKWVQKYEIDFVIIPSLTSKVLPFHSKLLNIFNQPIYNKLKIIFVNVGEYGGSEVFSIEHVKRIEESFRINTRDNVGEVIITRKIGETPKEGFMNLIGKFIFNWARLESYLRSILQKYGGYTRPEHISFLKQLDILFRAEILSIRNRNSIDQLRIFRNSIVHGTRFPTSADLENFNLILEDLLRNIQENISVRYGLD